MAVDDKKPQSACRRRADLLKELEPVKRAMIGALNESARAKMNGCVITNLCLKDYLEPALAILERIESEGK